MEYATIHRESGHGRPTPKFLQALRDLGESLERSPTACETCASGLATCVRMRDRQVTVTCRQCAADWRKATPIEKRMIRIRLARGGR